MCILEIGNKIELMDMGLTLGLMEMFMRESGLRERSMGRVLICLQMVISIVEIMSMESLKGKESTLGVMGVNMKANLRMD
jgi:hypothetical protein